MKSPELGFGFMRLPQTEEKEIDLPLVCKMVDVCMENGFNYFDSAYVYHNGKSEGAIKASLTERYPRDAFRVATKLPAWQLKSEADTQRIFDEQLERTGLDYFDYYLLHSVEKEHVLTYDRLRCWEWGAEMKAQGKIKSFGFSFHDVPELLDKVLGERPEVDFIQLQLNYLDWENLLVRAGDCYKVARKHNKPITVMSPLKGGTLSSLRLEFNEKLKSMQPDKSISSWAMRFAASLDGVSVVLSGMSNLEQIHDNIATMRNFQPLNDAEKACLDEVKKALLDAPLSGCTTCAYCVDGSCPKNIAIPDVLRAYDTILTYGDHDRPHFFYISLMREHGKAGDCISCGKCEALCPQHLPIAELMKKSSAVLDVEFVH